MLLPRLQPPLGIQRQADVRGGQQLLVELRLGEEVGGARLQVQHHVHPGLARRVDPLLQALDAELGGVVPVAARLRGGDGRDDLEGGDGRLLGEPVVLGDHLLHPLEGQLEVLLAQDPERGHGGGAVGRDHAPAGEGGEAAAGQLGRGRGPAQRLHQCRGVPEGVAEREHAHRGVLSGRLLRRGDALAAAADVPAGRLDDGAARGGDHGARERLRGRGRLRVDQQRHGGGRLPGGDLREVGVLGGEVDLDDLPTVPEIAGIDARRDDEGAGAEPLDLIGDRLVDARQHRGGEALEPRQQCLERGLVGEDGDVRGGEQRRAQGGGRRREIVARQHRGLGGLGALDGEIAPGAGREAAREREHRRARERSPGDDRRSSVSCCHGRDLLCDVGECRRSGRPEPGPVRSHGAHAVRAAERPMARRARVGSPRLVVVPRCGPDAVGTRLPG